MDKFDEKVIGYESTKEILRQILDILKRPEVYKRKGISIPRGLLMESDPGLGKSLLASILMEESERKPFVFRKTSQENSFLDELRTVFAMAKEEAPSILLLEDLNLYVESNSPYAPEWACLQACIVKCAAKGLAVGAEDLLGFSGFLCFKSSALFAANLLAVQPSSQKPLTGTLVQIGNFFFGLLKGQLDLLFCQGHQIFVDAL